MNPLLLIAVPLVLVIVGMILNSVGLSFDQPESSAEQDPAKRLAAERQAYRTFFDKQRTRFLKRQQRIGQYAWLVLITFVASFWWMYFDTVNKTAALNKIAVLQTLSAEGNQMVLSVTLRDGTNVKYLVKAEKAGTADGAVKEGLSKETVSSWEISRLTTDGAVALSVGDKALPLGVALKISN